MTYVVIALGLVAAFYVFAKAVGIARRIGLLGLLNALGVLSARFVAAFGKLIGGRDSVSPESYPNGASSGPAEDGRWTKAWDKVGAVSAPEQYLHHSDPEVSGLAQAHLDDD
jgi:hypothetical protein